MFPYLKIKKVNPKRKGKKKKEVRIAEIQQIRKIKKYILLNYIN